MSLKKWLDNQEVCDILGISKRTLQEYRAKWYGETEEVAEQKLPDQSGGILM